MTLLLIQKAPKFAEIIARVAGQHIGIKLGWKVCCWIIYFVIDGKLVSKKGYFGHLMKICFQGKIFQRSIHSFSFHKWKEKRLFRVRQNCLEHFVWSIASAVDSFQFLAALAAQHLFLRPCGLVHRWPESMLLIL